MRSRSVAAAKNGYRRRVTSYLQSLLGRSTPDTVAAQLLALSPESVGMSPEPSRAAIHAARAFLEAWELERLACRGLEGEPCEDRDLPRSVCC